MRALESHFERYMSERILSFAYLMCPSISGHKAQNKLSEISILNFSEKAQNIFGKGLKKYEVFVHKLF